LVNTKTPKYCGHYRHFFLVITITELRYAALTLTLMNVVCRERFPFTYIKKSLSRIEPKTYRMQTVEKLEVWARRRGKLG